jgi:RNA polymerase sigma-70 factor, ECF subfamily
MTQAASPMTDQPIARTLRASHNRGSCGVGDRGGGGAMEQHDSFTELAARLRAGDQGAATDVFRRFANRLIALARTELDARTRRKEDPEDIVQSVYRSFFTRYHAGQFDLATWDSLWSLLTVITARKCLNRAEYYLAKCRNATGEVGARWDDDAVSGLSEAIDREPTPLEAAVLAETVEQVMRGLEDDDRSIIELSLQGYTSPQISAQLGRAERTVRRVREYVKNRLRRMQADSAVVSGQ